MRQQWTAVAMAVLLLAVLSYAGPTQGATKSESSLGLTFEVEHGEWSLISVQQVPGPCRPDWTLRGSSFYLALLDDKNQVISTQPLGRPELRFFDYQDSLEHLDGEVQARDHYLVRTRVPNDQEYSQLVIHDKQQRQVLELSSSQINAAKSAKQVSWPIYALDTLIYNGDPANKVDILILGDGYITIDTATFLNNCNMHVSHFFGLTPYAHYSERFNIYAVTTISNERGGDHPESGVYRDTYYNAEYSGRLLVVDDYIAFGVANEHAPQWDEIWMLVQDPTYGGSGSPEIAVSYAASTQVLSHEFGHSFGMLWDEYSYGGNGVVGSAPNCDDHAVSPKWQAWIDSVYPGVGTYIGCSYDNTYRPTHSSCMMLELKDYYCIVCVEQLINRIYAFAPDPIQSASPEQNVFMEPGEGQTFAVSYTNQNDYPLELSWTLDGMPQPDSTETSFYFSSPAVGDYTLTLTLRDTTSLVLNLDDSTLTRTYTWDIRSAELLCGDCNADAFVNITDAVWLIQYIFAGGPAPDPIEAGDPDCSGLANVTDAVYLISYIFAQGPEPCADCRLLYSDKRTDTRGVGSL